MSKKAILGLPLKELIGLILAAMVLVFLWYVTADLRKVFFGDPSLTPVKASFDTFSNTITRMINNDKIADAAIMPYHIAPADVKWKVDPVYVLVPFNKQKEFIVKVGKKVQGKIKAPENCKQRVCVCSCEAPKGSTLKEDICSDKKSFCTTFNSEYTIHFSTPNGWLGRWFFYDLQKHIVNFHMIKYDKDIYVYAGIPFEEAIKKTKLLLDIKPYAIEHQIGTDALKFYNDGIKLDKGGEHEKAIIYFEKAIFFFNQIIKEYKQKTAPFVMSKYYIAVSYNALGNYSLAKDYYEDFEKQAQEVEIYGDKKGEWSKKKLEELKKRYTDNKFSRSETSTTNTCYLSNKAAEKKFENNLYDEAIIDFNWVINSCKDRNYTYEVCVARFYLGKIYKKKAEDDEKYKEKAKEHLGHVVVGECADLEAVYEEYDIPFLLRDFKENIEEAKVMLNELNS